MAYRPKSPKWDTFLDLLDRWEPLAEEAIRTYSLARKFQPDIDDGYRAPPKLHRAGREISRLRQQLAPQVDGEAFDALCAELGMPEKRDLRDLWQKSRKMLERLRYLGVQETPETSAAPSRPKPKQKRRAIRPRKPRPPTVRQLEVIQTIAECRGNIAEAARRLGRDRRTIEESYKAGMKKAGKVVYHSKDKTRLLNRDRREQETVSAEDDTRRR